MRNRLALLRMSIHLASYFTSFSLETGHSPASPTPICFRAIQQDIPAEAPLRSRNVPRDLQAICLKCLAKQPHLRYSTRRNWLPTCGGT